MYFRTRACNAFKKIKKINRYIGFLSPRCSGVLENLMSNSFLPERSAASSAAAVGRGRCYQIASLAIQRLMCIVQVGGSSRLTDFGPIDGPQEWDIKTTASRRSGNGSVRRYTIILVLPSSSL